MTAGCRRGKEQAPPPGSESARSNAAPAADGERKPSTFARLLGRDTVPAYGWDGHASSTTLSTSPDIIFDSSLSALRSMGFSIKTEETRRQGASGRVFGAKTDKTQALVTLEPKAGGNGKSTELKVKVGTVGDRTGSERVLDEIQEAIAKAPRK